MGGKSLQERLQPGGAEEMAFQNLRKKEKEKKNQHVRIKH
jgi:hypothetical protein